MVTLLTIRLHETPLILAMALAFVGGLLSFASPCCLPLIPGYLGHLAGTTVAPGSVPTRRSVLSHAVAFVLGFSTLFTMSGIAVGQVLQNFQAAQGYIRWVGGAVIILMGLHTTGLIRIPVLHRTFKMHPALPTFRWTRQRLGIVARPLPVRAGEDAACCGTDAPSGSDRSGLGRSFLVGIFFAAGWSPCVGPILSGIYAVAGTQPANAGILFFLYSMGLGVPFLLVALFFGKIRGGLWHLNRYYNVVSFVSGLFLIFIGILLFTDTFSRLARYTPVFNLPGVVR